MIGFRQNRNAGEFILRFARSRKLGDRRLLSGILRDDDERFMVGALVAEKVEEKMDEEVKAKAGELGKGDRSLASIFQWIKDHQEEIKAIIALITSLFASPSK